MIFSLFNCSLPPSLYHGDILRLQLNIRAFTLFEIDFHSRRTFVSSTECLLLRGTKVHYLCYEDSDLTFTPSSLEHEQRIVDRLHRETSLAYTYHVPAAPPSLPSKSINLVQSNVRGAPKDCIAADSCLLLVSYLTTIEST